MGGIRVHELKTCATPCSRSTAKYMGVRNSSFRISTAYWPSRGSAEKNSSSRTANRSGVTPLPRPDRLELEDERPRVAREVALVGLVDCLEEQVGIEKIGIHLAGARLVQRLGESMHGELVPHLAHAGKSRWQALRVGRERGVRGRRVEAGVDAHGAEEGEGGVLLEHPGRGRPAPRTRDGRPVPANPDSSTRRRRSEPARAAARRAPRSPPLSRHDP